MPTHFLILLVDDDPELLAILKLASQTSFPEARFVQKHSTSEAKAYLSGLDGHGPKLILLDINLNESVNGLDFLAFVRSTAPIRSLPVIMLTVSQSDADLQRAYGLGASSFTTKPFNLEGWKTYAANLRLYWLETVTLPPIKFYKA